MYVLDLDGIDLVCDVGIGLPNIHGAVDASGLSYWKAQVRKGNSSISNFLLGLLVPTRSLSRQHAWQADSGFRLH